MPNLIKFKVSSPGKVILHGEHSVVYGKPAIAGVIGLRNYLNFIETENENVSINFDRFDITLELSLDKINEFMYKSNEITKNIKFPHDIDHNNFFEYTKMFINENYNNYNNENILNGFVAVLYLMAAISNANGLNKFEKCFTIEIKSEMSIGAGLGSSASFGVCLAAAFTFYSAMRKSIDYAEVYKKLDSLEMKKLKESISSWAFCSEKIMHGNPSGIDNTICTFGNIVKFFKGSPPTEIKLVNPLNVLLVDTQVSRSTSKLVADVVNLKNEFPSLVGHLLDGMGELVENAINILENNDEKLYEKLKILIKINNNLLRSLGVSHQKLEQIFQISEQFGFGAKLTGAGGGGYATILLPNDYKIDKNFIQLCQCLTKANFEFKETTVGGEGLTFDVIDH